MRHVVEKIISEEGEGELWLNYYVRRTPPPPPPPQPPHTHSPTGAHNYDTDFLIGELQP